MSFPESTIRKVDRLLQRIGAPVPPGYWDLDIAIKQREWNGIGSASGNSDGLHHNLAGNTAFVAAWKPVNEAMLTTGWGYTI